ncbi:hypothetical protein TNCV_875431 [Trichonephila clavipes]|nr:hypothetical protein TNCV_875431 [Trichonephila clavipes]
MAQQDIPQEPRSDSRPLRKCLGPTFSPRLNGGRESLERARRETIYCSPPTRLPSTRATPALRLVAKFVAKDDNWAFKMLNTTSGVTRLDFCVKTGYGMWIGNTSLIESQRYRNVW